MFSFHKPKVYRSTAGCCICKAKSSSSRFTDSKKYETDFIKCFQLDNPRRGEICNACVLLVKRFKRLPPGSNRHWGHVVDARTGPGLKSMTKFKKRKEEAEGKDSNYVSKIFKKNKKKAFKKETSSLGGSSDDSPPSPTESQGSDDYDDGIFEKKYFSYSTRAQQLKREEAALKAKRKRKNPHPTKNSRWPDDHFNLFSDVVSDDQWTQRITCCGSFYESTELHTVIINVATFKPCGRHKNVPPNDLLSLSSSIASAAASSTSTIISNEVTPVPEITTTTTTTTAIKKHQLFLKRHSEPSSVVKSCDKSSKVTDFSNNEKTEPMKMDSTTKTTMEKDNIVEEKKNGHGNGKMEDMLMQANENAFEQKEIASKLLQELTQETTKIVKPTSMNPLSSVNGDKMSLLKYKLANMARFGAIGNDNSSDSGYEEVQDGNKLLTIAQMPPPADVMQSL